MKRVEFELDDATSALVEAMAKSEGVQVEQISREALTAHLKKFTSRCITTSADNTSEKKNFYPQVYNHPRKEKEKQECK